MTAAPCAVCGHADEAPVHTAREMMFGTGGEYRYRECPDCGTLQLLDVPDDLSAHYPPDYYSYDDRPRRRLEGLVTWARTRRTQAYLEGGCPLGSLILKRFGPTPTLRMAKAAGLDRSARILDVGCGSGELLLDLRRDGFCDLTGADPFLDAPIDHGGGLRILKASMDELEGSWDLVMSHHSLEHMPDPAAAFAGLARLAGPDGHVLMRIPVADSHAWREYGTDWVQLDAPRHLFLLTDDAVARLADAAGLDLVRRERDSTAFQFWASEQYRRGIPLRDPRSHAVDPAASPFAPDEMARWSAAATKLNDEVRGDQAAYLLRRRG